MPGSGKSTLGKALSSQLGLPFIDLDHLIEQSTGQTVSNIFESQGEEAFREIERKTLLNCLEENQKFVLSTGGGTPCFFNSSETLSANGLVIFVNTDLKEILKRLLGKEAEKRPLMAGWDKNAFEKNLQDKYDKRLPYYNQAHLEIKGDEPIELISHKIRSFKLSSL